MDVAVHSAVVGEQRGCCEGNATVTSGVKEGGEQYVERGGRGWCEIQCGQRLLETALVGLQPAIDFVQDRPTARTTPVVCRATPARWAPGSGLFMRTVLRSAAMFREASPPVNQYLRFPVGV